MRGPNGELVSWLLEGDPAIRWRALRDLEHAPAAVVAVERARVATEGWGARLLALQDSEGGWGGGDYSPKWISTTYTLLALHWLGLPRGNAAALRGCARLWRWAERRQPETCIAGIFVLLGSSHGYAGPEVEQTLTWLLEQQLDDGGWNCAALTRHGGTDLSRHGSFHTSITALDALTEYRTAGGDLPVGEALSRGEEFFLRHRLDRSHKTGEPAIRRSTRFPQFPQWHFDVMRGLEHFAAVDAERDPRLAEAVEAVRRAQRRDGRWPTYAGYPGRTWFRMEDPGASRWNTLRALRVLGWWNRDTEGQAQA